MIRGLLGLAQQVERFRLSDVTTWGVVALAMGACAVLSANLSTVLPPGLLSGLHASRAEGIGLVQLRNEVAGLNEELARVRRDTATLVNRIALSEDHQGAVTRRVGALEISLPALVEAVPTGAVVDRSSITAAIGGEPATVEIVEGGSIAVTTQPLLGPPDAAAQTTLQPAATVSALDQPLPDAIVPEDAWGVVLGSLFDEAGAEAAWLDMNAKAGPLLMSYQPLISGEEPGRVRLVAGPILDLASAEALCDQVVTIGILCLPTAYEGAPLAR